MNTHEQYMQRALELARKGAGRVSPNPMVGCVIVHKHQIIGEGYHERYGEAHAEVNAIASVNNPELLTQSTLYVTLEPCAHYGKTPPCADLIVRKQIPHVVIGTVDPFAKVAGKGIEKLKKAGIEVEVDILGKECRELNKRFFTFHEKKRPYIFLKWAQTLDGFIDIDRSQQDYGEPTWITGDEALLQVHRMRAEEDAILVGRITAEKDNPSLTVRRCPGKNPLRIVIDRELRLPATLNLLDNSTPTLVVNAHKNEQQRNTEYLRLNFSEAILPQLLDELYRRNILSLIVEGGKQLLESFITANLWDEAHVYSGPKNFGEGVKAPQIDSTPGERIPFGNDWLSIYKNY